MRHNHEASLLVLAMTIGACAAANSATTHSEHRDKAPAQPAPSATAPKAATTALAPKPSATPGAKRALPTASPAPKAPRPKVKLIASGRSHSCALLENNALYCWGAGGDGQLGVGQKDSAKPLRVNDVGTIKAMALGAGHSCALLDSGKVTCWGKVPPSEEVIAPTPVAQLDQVTALAVGASFSCVMRSNDIGKVRCWGFNKKHQLCDGSSINRSKPMAIPSLFRVSHMALGNRHGCVHRKGSVECFGANGHGQVVALLAPRPTRSVVAATGKSTWLSAGEHHSCSGNAQAVTCWGSNLHGALAQNNPKERGPVTIPLDKVRNNEDILQLVSGRHHSCVRTRSRVLCWGSNKAGQLGAGALQAVELDAASHITAGGNFGCALSAKDASVRCWGGNAHGQLGQPPSITGSPKPSRIDF